MVSFGMLPALASTIAFRKRAFPSGSPPPDRAATVISLMNFVKSLPRLASSAPFLCLILCHLECPDMRFDPLRNARVVRKAIYHKIRGGYTSEESPSWYDPRINRNGALCNVFVDDPTLHYEYDATDCCNVFQRIAIEGDDVCLQSRSNRTDL